MRSLRTYYTGRLSRPPRRVAAAADARAGTSRPGYGATPMVTVTGTAQKAAWDERVMPPVEEVRPGLWSIPVPIPINPLRYVLVYAFELAGDGVGLVDAGWDTDEAWSALTGGLATLGAGLSDVRAVVVTHIHPDHYGLAGRVREASGAWIGLHPADAALLQERYVDVDGLIAAMRGLLELSGVPAATLPDLSEASLQVRSFVSMAPPDVLLEDGRIVEFPGWDLRTMWTPGHSPGHVCLYSDEQRLLLSGDHVLPRITPNISFHSQQVPNPLGDYLDSLARMRALEPDEVLPAHEYRFADLPTRLEQIERHHAARLDEIETALREHPGSTAWELTTGLAWSRPWDEVPAYMRRAANGETLAHLVLLERRARLRREPGVPARFYLQEGRRGGGDHGGRGHEAGG
jgi:glyoxylase-like metal-dependent hydrolase (beta-lactamase superfamily II)